MYCGSALDFKAKFCWSCGKPCDGTISLSFLDEKKEEPAPKAPELDFLKSAEDFSAGLGGPVKSDPGVPTAPTFVSEQKMNTQNQAPVSVQSMPNNPMLAAPTQGQPVMNGAPAAMPGTMPQAMPGTMPQAMPGTMPQAGQVVQPAPVPAAPVQPAPIPVPVGLTREEAEAAARKAEEDRKQAAEAATRRAEEEKKRAEEEAKKAAEEAAKKAEEEKRAAEEAAKKAEEERKRAAEEAAKKAEEERKRAAEEAAKRAEEAKKAAEEAAKKAEEERKRAAEEAAKKAEEAKKAAEEAAKKAEEERRRAAEEAAKKAEEEKKRAEEEAARKAAEEKKRAEEEAARKAAEEKKHAEEEAARKAAEEARRKEEERKRAEEEARRKEEERKRAEEEARRKEEEERKRREAEEAARKAAEEKAKEIQTLKKESAELGKKALDKCEEDSEEARTILETALDKYHEYFRKAEIHPEQCDTAEQYWIICEILGVTYYQEHSYKLSAPLLRVSAASGRSRGRIYYTDLILRNRKELPEEPEALKKMLTEALEDEEIQEDEYEKSHALYCLGRIYEEGLTVEKSMPEAFRYYKECAELGSPAAMAMVGQCYLYGDGVKKDPKEALKWNLKAGQAGQEKAIRNLAVAYDFGSGTAKNGKEAVNWYKKLLERVANDRFAMYRIAWCLVDPEKEYGMHPDEEAFKEARSYAEKALAEGEKKAEFILGYYDLQSFDKGPDLNSAAAHFTKAASHGDEKSKKWLGRMVRDAAGNYTLR